MDAAAYLAATPEAGVKITTMKDIADIMGISVGTVSRALNDDGRISSERRKAIQAFARLHNFTPNVMAGSLRKRRMMKVIGVIIPQFTHFYFSSILAGIEQEAMAHGYHIIVATSNEDYEQEVTVCKSFFEGRVCGVIVSQAKSTQQYDHFQKLINFGLPLVFYDRICTGVDASRVVVDDYMGAFTAVEHLVKMGCRRVALYSSPMDMEISKNRYNGWRDALLKYGINPDDCVHRYCDNREDAEIITPEVMTAESKPDAFFAVNDDTAIGIMYTLKHMGYRIPEDISICGFTNGQRAIACDPMLTTVEQNGMEVGRVAAQLLIDKIEGRTPLAKVEKRIVRTRLIVRGSTRKEKE